MLVCLAVIEYIPGISDARHSSVNIAKIIESLCFIMIPLQKQIPKADQSPSIDKPAIRLTADSIAQFMIMARGIDKDIVVSILSDRTCLKELMVRK